MPLLNRRSFLQDVCSQIKWRGAHQEICKELDCNFGDLVDYVPDEEEK